jgi:hypothetical protein
VKEDAEWERWRTWLGDEPTGRNIYAQTVEMLAFRQIWDGFAYVYNNAPDRAREEGTFLLWVRYAYARSQSMGVRRMADKGADVVSLARLIDRVWRFPWVLTRERFLAMQGGDEGFGLGHGWFESRAGTGDYIDPRIPARDFEDLQTKTKSVRDWVNKSVAHLAARSRTGPPLNDVHDAIDFVAGLFRKYQTLIGGVNVQLGVIMEPWPSVFRVPWIPDDDQFRDVMAQLDAAERRFLENPQA